MLNIRELTKLCLKQIVKYNNSLSFLVQLLSDVKHIDIHKHIYFYTANPVRNHIVSFVTFH